MSDQSHIVFDQAGLGYNNRCLLENVNLSLESGNIHCVFGRNGSGKTTLLKSLGGLIPLVSGDIRIGDASVKDMSEARLASKLSVILTHRPGIANMLASEYVAYGRYPYLGWLGRKSEADVEAIEEAMELCGIPHLRKRMLNELSDGEFQKVQIARVLCQDTDILLLDETVAHMDLANKAEVFHLIQKLSREKWKTILLSSHDLQFTSQLADHILAIHDGKVVKMSANEFLKDEYYLKIFGVGGAQYDWKTNAIDYRIT